MVFSNIEVRVKRAGPSGLWDLEVTEYIARIRSGRPGRSRERTAHLSTWQRPMQDSCLTNYCSAFTPKVLHISAFHYYCYYPYAHRQLMGWASLASQTHFSVCIRICAIPRARERHFGPRKRAARALAYKRGRGWPGQAGSN